MKGYHILQTVTLLASVVLRINGAVVTRHIMEYTSYPPYLEPAPQILPSPDIDPSSIVLPSGTTDNAGLVLPAGAVEPAPQIAPAPAILPADAIKEKNRAYPESKRSLSTQIVHRRRPGEEFRTDSEEAFEGDASPRQAVYEALVTTQQASASELKNSPAERKNHTSSWNDAGSIQTSKAHASIIYKGQTNYIPPDKTDPKQRLKPTTKALNTVQTGYIPQEENISGKMSTKLAKNESSARVHTMVFNSGEQKAIHNSQNHFIQEIKTPIFNLSVKKSQMAAAKTNSVTELKLPNASASVIAPQPAPENVTSSRVTSPCVTSSHVMHTPPKKLNSSKVMQHFSKTPLFQRSKHDQNSSLKYRYLREHGAKLWPYKLHAAPVPFHFVIRDKTTKPTTPPTRTRARTGTRTRTGTTAATGTGTSKILPTQTHFIPHPIYQNQVWNSSKLNPSNTHGATVQTLFIPHVSASNNKSGCSGPVNPDVSARIQELSQNDAMNGAINSGNDNLVSLSNETPNLTEDEKHLDAKADELEDKNRKLVLDRLNTALRKLKKFYNGGVSKKNKLVSKLRGHFNKLSHKLKAMKESKYSEIFLRRKTKWTRMMDRKRSLQKFSERVRHRLRERRQLLLPFSNAVQQDTLRQQLLRGLSAQPVFPDVQPVIPDAQHVLEQLLTVQPREDLVSPGQLNRQLPLMIPALTQPADLRSPIDLPQAPLFQQQQLPLFQLSPVQNSLSSLPLLSAPAEPLSALAYQSQVSQDLAPVSSLPYVLPGRVRQSIPLMSQSSYDDYPAYGYRRHRYHRGSRRRPHMQFYHDPETYRSFEDIYGKSPSIFDDLRDIGSQIDKYGDHDSPQYDRTRHTQKEWVESAGDRFSDKVEDDNDGISRDYHRAAKKTHTYAEPEEYRSEYDNPEIKDEEIREQRKELGDTDAGFKDRIDPQESNEKGTDEKEVSTLHPLEETENATKDTKIRKNDKKQNDHQSDLKDDSKDKAADAFEIQETSEAELKRKEFIDRLDKDAVMHLDFDKTSEKKNIVQDTTANGNDADLSSGATITTKSLGTCGRGAILKKGEVSYHGKSFTRKPTNAVSIAMWVKSKNAGFIHWFDQSDGQKDSFFTRTKSPAVPKKRWTHLAGTFDTKTGVARIYVNGQLKLEKVGKKNNGLPQDFTSTGIGKKFGDDHVSFLDEVFMFDRVISPEEVSALYRKCEFNRMIVHYGFQHWDATTNLLDDQSGLENNATLKSGAHVVNSGCDKCGACLDLSSDDKAEVYLDSTKYRRKPTSAISVSAWISLNRTTGLHSIFQALKGKNGTKNLYNLEVIDGKLHWQSKGKDGNVIFNVLTKQVTIPEGLWTHVTGTYNAKTGSAKLYVNGLLRSSFTNASRPRLSAAWGRASIGGHFPDNKPFDGLLDEFFLYNWELDPSEVQFVLKYCADKPKLVSFTVKVPLL